MRGGQEVPFRDDGGMTGDETNNARGRSVLVQDRGRAGRPSQPTAQ